MTPNPEAIEIRRAATIADYFACQEAQRRAWGLTEESYVVPIATLVGANRHGGLVLGAFLPDGNAVGVSFAFLALIEGQLGLYSQLTGVVPGHQAHGLGRRLKYLQRDIARAEGLPLIAWAFDPFQVGNANFNLNVLGATCGEYVEDMYGPRTDRLNAGVPTDRLIAVWRTDPQGEPADRPGPDRPSLTIEIPADIAALARTNPDEADRRRREVRAAFHAAFAAGYRAEALIRPGPGEPGGPRYVLRR